MPILNEIRLYPIKSCAGISLPTADLTAHGLRSGWVYDRAWMVVDTAGNMMSQRNYPQMARIKTLLQDGQLRVHCLGLDLPDLNLPQQVTGENMQVTIWDDTFAALRQNAAINAWFSAALGETCYLVRMSPQTTRMTSAKWSGSDQAAFHFADGYPYLITNLHSLAELNGRLQQAERPALRMDRFRANLVLDQLAAYEEDYLSEISFDNGANLRLVKPCSRCNMPSIDQDSGNIGPDPLDIMQSYRAKDIVDGGICFGMNALLNHGQGLTVQVGMAVQAELAF